MQIGGVENNDKYGNMINCIGTLGSDDQARGMISRPNGEEGGSRHSCPASRRSMRSRWEVLAS